MKPSPPTVHVQRRQSDGAEDKGGEETAREKEHKPARSPSSQAPSSPLVEEGGEGEGADPRRATAFVVGEAEGSPSVAMRAERERAKRETDRRRQVGGLLVS
jgi:hypothetical protein